MRGFLCYILGTITAGLSLDMAMQGAPEWQAFAAIGAAAIMMFGGLIMESASL
ncbi:hypothetical protein BH10PLA2_BH10PLA2_08290 [soil metagenome]